MKPSKALYYKRNIVTYKYHEAIQINLINPLVSITYNMSLSEGIFPNLLKEARVCPTYKKALYYKRNIVAYKYHETIQNLVLQTKYCYL